LMSTPGGGGGFLAGIFENLKDLIKIKKLGKNWCVPGMVDLIKNISLYIFQEIKDFTPKMVQTKLPAKKKKRKIVRYFAMGLLVYCD